MAEALTRAWLVNEVTAYLDAERRVEFLRAVSRPLREVLEGPPGHGNDWIPLSHLVEALIVADRLVGDGDSSRSWDIGKFAATHEIGAVQSLAMKVLRPWMIISLAPSLWGTHFKDAGRVKVRSTGDSAILVSFVDVPEPTRTYCLAIGGWMQGWLGLGKRGAIVVQHVACRCQGALSCDYAVTWEEAGSIRP